MLRAVDLVAADGVPVLGVNVGQLGYLTEIEPAGLWDVARAVRWRATTPSRSGCCCRSRSSRADGDRRTLLALNEAVLEKTPMGHTVRLDVQIDGAFFTTYAADGLIVATADRLDRLRLSGPRPDRRPDPPGHAAHPGVAPHAVRPHRSCSSPTPSCASRCAATGRPRWRSTGANIGELGAGRRHRVHRVAGHRPGWSSFGPRDFHRILKAKFGLSDR